MKMRLLGLVVLAFMLMASQAYAKVGVFGGLGGSGVDLNIPQQQTAPGPNYGVGGSDSLNSGMGTSRTPGYLSEPGNIDLGFGSNESTGVRK